MMHLSLKEILMLTSFCPALLQSFDPNAAAGLGCAMIAFIMIFGLAVLAFFIWCWWRIFTKAGYNGALALLNLIPGIGPIIAICILAFGEWPINKQ